MEHIFCFKTVMCYFGANEEKRNELNYYIIVGICERNRD